MAVLVVLVLLAGVVVELILVVLAIIAICMNITDCIASRSRSSNITSHSNRSSSNITSSSSTRSICMNITGCITSKCSGRGSSVTSLIITSVSLSISVTLISNACSSAH